MDSERNHPLNEPFHLIAIPVVPPSESAPQGPTLQEPEPEPSLVIACTNNVMPYANRGFNVEDQSRTTVGSVPTTSTSDLNGDPVVENDDYDVQVDHDVNNGVQTNEPDD
ncbi:hypothetical protein BpHYR1_020894 [Brachionus plicatilis]|uniref:Uncharacterized protein n=1 Tax=Brachionus plicatilis TaxID=10195 RepID=A0A3M7RWN1_BRAPC|nr:hypothetical protein BpHYR1_020894 [Brachionus plicatilis]